MGTWLATLVPPSVIAGHSEVTWTPTLTSIDQIQQYDTIIVEAQFGSYIEPSGQPYAAAEYWNLHVAAVPVADLSTLNHAWWTSSEHQGFDLVNIATDEAGINTMNYPAGSTTNYCVGATSESKMITRGDSSASVIYKWTFTYNQPASADWGLVFAYGDPHVEYWNSSTDHSSFSG